MNRKTNLRVLVIATLVGAGGSAFIHKIVFAAMAYSASPAASFLTAVFCGLLGALIAMPKVMRQRYSLLSRETFSEWFREGGVRIVASIIIAILASLWKQEPEQDPVRSIYLHVEIFGFLFVAGLPLWRMLVGSYEPAQMGRLVGDSLGALAAYQVMLSLVGLHGDALYILIQERPTESISVAITLVAAVVITRIMVPAHESAANTAFSPSGTARMRSRQMHEGPLITPRDHRYVAAHEAGHALVCAALGALPEEFEVVAAKGLRECDELRFLGYVSGIAHGHRLTEERFSQWRMLMLLAGGCAEKKLNPDVSLGSSEDYRRWIEQAKVHLRAGCGTIYYPEPEGPFEQAHNTQALEQMRTQQEELLEDFFSLNAEVLESLTEALIEHGRLAHSELAAFLSRVRFPEAFPMPFGAFDAFAQNPDAWADRTR